MGDMPASGFIYANLNISGGTPFFTKIYGLMYNSDGCCPLPYSHPSNIIYNIQLTIDSISASNARIGIAVGDDIWHNVYNFKAIAIVEYTKS